MKCLRHIVKQELKMIDESKLIKKMIVLQVLGFIGGFLVGVALGFKLGNLIMKIMGV